MQHINLIGFSLRDLHRLLEGARRELDAANDLLLARGRAHDRSVALHLLRGWYALACLEARQTGMPEPELEKFSLDSRSRLLSSLPDARRSGWARSFESLRRSALSGPEFLAALQPGGIELRRQARLLGRCLAAQRSSVAPAPHRERRLRFGLRQLVFLAASLLVVLAVFGLGRRLVNSLQHIDWNGAQSKSIRSEVHVDVSELSEPKERNSDWDAPGTIQFEHRVIVDLRRTVNHDTLSVSLDGNDRYLVRLMAGLEEVGLIEVEPTMTGGLETYELTVPEDAFEHGYDFVVVEVDEGDNCYSLGHLLLGPVDHEERPGEEPAE